MSRILGAALVLAFAACGDGGGGGGAAPPPKPVKAPPKKPDSKKVLLNVYPKVEDRVPVNERATIRHQFRERDFASDPTGTENRDPFRSYVVSQPGTLNTSSSGSVEPTTFCTRKEQMVASNYNLRELRLVGIVTRGAKKYALFQDPADVGRIVHRGDCLGREKARVKDIGSGFVTLEMIAEQVPNQPPRPNEERSIPLYPEELKLGEGDDPGAPVVTPPAMPTQPPPPGGTTTPVMPEQPAAPAPKP